METPKADPPRREDGKCACGCGVALQTGGHSRRPTLLDAHLGREPFATAACCRRYHEVVLSQPEDENRARKARSASTPFGQTALRGRRRSLAATLADDHE